MNTISAKIIVHILRSLPPNAVNCGEDGLPKKTTYGGADRALISTQSQKYAWRQMVRIHNVPVAKRTREAGQLLLDPLVELGHDAEDAWNLLKGFLPLVFAGVELPKKRTNKEDEEEITDRYQTNVVMAVSQEEVAAVVETLHNNFDIALPTITVKNDHSVTVAKDSILRKLARDLTERFGGWTSAVDLALHGRLVTQNIKFTMPAAAQVAHMFTTNAVQPQPNFFVGGDDLSNNAAMMGTKFQYAGCYYQAIALNPEQLLINLGDDRDLFALGVREFLRATVLVIPKGQTAASFADTLPGLVMVEVRPATYSYAQAFEDPIRGDGVLRKSVKALANYVPMANGFAGRPLWTGVMPGTPGVSEELKDSPLAHSPDTHVIWFTTLDQLVQDVLEQVKL